VTATSRLAREVGGRSAAIVALLIAALLPVGLSVHDEWTVSKALADRDRQASGEGFVSPSAGLRPDALPPCAAMIDASILARSAVTKTGEERADLLGRALRLLAPALAARPKWGEAWALAAYIAVLAHGADDAGARAALVRSYADAPYLVDSALWRIRYGLSLWSALDPGTRVRVVREAIWLAGVKADLGAMDQLFAGTSAEPLYASERAAARAGAWRR
jgi:hypothetical protein